MNATYLLVLLSTVKWLIVFFAVTLHYSYPLTKQRRLEDVDQIIRVVTIIEELEQY